MGAEVGTGPAADLRKWLDSVQTEFKPFAFAESVEDALWEVRLPGEQLPDASSLTGNPFDHYEHSTKL